MASNSMEFILLHYFKLKLYFCSNFTIIYSILFFIFNNPNQIVSINNEISFFNH